VIVIGPPCPNATPHASRVRGFVDNNGSVYTSPATAWRRINPTKGTTPARGGGGEGRRASAPGGRADAPSAKPSDAYYTHESVTRRKGCLRKISKAFK
jgi:hypothetical protein